VSLEGILIAVSIIIVAGLIVVNYQDNPIAELSFNIEGLTEIIEGDLPTIEYLGYEIIDPESSFRLMFNVTNNSDEELTINTINFTAYCAQHEEVLLGYGHGEGLPLTVSGRSYGTLSIFVICTVQGQTHIENYHIGDEDFHLTLKNVLLVVQGVEVELEDEIDVGPIEIPQ